MVFPTLRVMIMYGIDYKPAKTMGRFKTFIRGDYCGWEDGRAGGRGGRIFTFEKG